MPKIITREEVIFKIKEHQGLWQVPNPIVWKLDSYKRKMYWLICRCGTGKWIRWAHLSKGERMGCRSCRKKTHGKRYTPLYQTWFKIKPEAIPSWQDFLTFEKWAAPLYEKGWKLIRIDSNLPYGPNNCDYVPIRKKKARSGDPASLQANLVSLPIVLPSGLRRVI